MLHKTLPELEAHFNKLDETRLKEVIKEARESKAHAEKTMNKVLAGAAIARINRAYQALEDHEKGGD